MEFAVQLVLIFLPLAVYLYILGLWHSARTPVVIRGPRDVLWFCGGISGILVFGPVGEGLFGTPMRGLDPLVAVRVLAAYGIAVILISMRFRNRFVLYNLDPVSTQRLIQHVVTALPGRFQPRSDGFEDPHKGRTIHWETSARMRTAAITLRGTWPETTRDIFLCELETQARAFPAYSDPASASATRPNGWAWFGGSCLVMLIPLLALCFAQPRGKNVFWLLLQQMRGE